MLALEHSCWVACGYAHDQLSQMGWNRGLGSDRSCSKASAWNLDQLQRPAKHSPRARSGPGHWPPVHNPEKYCQNVWPIALFLKQCSKRATQWLCEQAGSCFIPSLQPIRSHLPQAHGKPRKLKVFFKVPPPPRPRSGRSAALRPTGHARGSSTTPGGDQTRVFLPNPANTAGVSHS